MVRLPKLCFYFFPIDIILTFLHSFRDFNFIYQDTSSLNRKRYHQYLLEWIGEKHLSILKSLSFIFTWDSNQDGLVSVTFIENFVLLLKTNESQRCHK